MTITDENWELGTHIHRNDLNLRWTDGVVQPATRAFRVVLGLCGKVFIAGGLQGWFL